MSINIYLPKVENGKVRKTSSKQYKLNIYVPR